jgi:hypothetical protein
MRLQLLLTAALYQIRASRVQKQRCVGHETSEGGMLQAFISVDDEGVEAEGIACSMRDERRRTANCSQRYAAVVNGGCL